MIPFQRVELAPFSRNIQYFHGFVDRIICMSSFNYVLSILQFCCLLVLMTLMGRLCGLVVRALATDPEVPGSILGSTRFSEK
jgi:hypothetical protein